MKTEVTFFLDSKDGLQPAAESDRATQEYACMSGDDNAATAWAVACCVWWK